MEGGVIQPALLFPAAEQGDRVGIGAESYFDRLELPDRRLPQAHRQQRVGTGQARVGCQASFGGRGIAVLRDPAAYRRERIVHMVLDARQRELRLRARVAQSDEPVAGADSVKAAWIGGSGRCPCRAGAIVVADRVERFPKPEEGLRALIVARDARAQIAPAFDGWTETALLELHEGESELGVVHARARARHRQHATVLLRGAVEIGQAFANAARAEDAVGGVRRTRESVRDAFQHADAGAVLTETNQRHTLAVHRLRRACVRWVLLEERAVGHQRLPIAALREPRFGGLEGRCERIALGDQLVQRGLSAATAVSICTARRKKPAAVDGSGASTPR